MKINRKVLIAAIAVVALAAGGIGIAYGVGGESEVQGDQGKELVFHISEGLNTPFPNFFQGIIRSSLFSAE